MSPIILVILVVVLLVAFVFFSLCEALIVHLGVARAATLVAVDEDRAAALTDLLDRREESLAAVVAVRLVAQVGIVGIIVTEAADRGVDSWGWAGVAVPLVAVLGLAELVPKAAAIVRTDRVALLIAPVAVLASRVPILGLAGRLVVGVARRGSNGGDPDEVQHVSEEELLAFAEVAANSEVIDVEEQHLIKSIIEFGDTIVREVMVPRPDMVTVDGSWEIGNVMEVVILNGFSRIPVVGDGIDDVVGIVYAKDLMRAERDGRDHDLVRDHMRLARVVPEQKRVAELLPEMQSEQFHMAVVIDEYGGTAGLVTLEDLIEELVGEIVDEFDVEDPMAEPLADGAYRVNARMPVDELNDLMGVELPEGDYDSIGGLVFEALGHVPAMGESVEIADCRLTAVRIQGRRIGLVRIEPIVPAESTLAEDPVDAP